MLKVNLAPLSNPLRPVWDALNKHSKREESGTMNNDGSVELDCILKVRHHPDEDSEFCIRVGTHSRSPIRVDRKA